MKTIFIVPELGEADTVGTVANLLVAPGDTVTQDQALIEVETDKVVVEIPAESAGTVVEFLLAPGDSAAQGQPFVAIETEGAGDEIAAHNDADAKNDVAAQADSTSDSGALEKHEVSTPAENSPPPTSRQEYTSRAPSDVPAASTPAGPAARRLARELGIDICRVKGTGYKGRISKNDVKASVFQHMQGETQHTNLPTPELPDLSEYGPIERCPLNGIQKATRDNMTHCARRIPHAWLQEEIDITDLERLRQQQKDQVKERGGALTLTAMLCKALAGAATRHPIFNSSYDDKSEEIAYRKQVNIGVAVDTPRGLLVPVISDVENLSIFRISQQLKELSSRSRSGKISARDLKGGSITLSNLGGIGTRGVFPIINWPEVAIVGIGKSKWQLCFPDEDLSKEPSPRLIMTITLAFDHRIINGADGARFLSTIKSMCEDPGELAIG